MITISSSSTSTSSSCKLNNSFSWTTFKAKWFHKLIHPISRPILMERSKCNISHLSLVCSKASNSSSSQCNSPVLTPTTITIVECNFQISNSNNSSKINNINSQISFRFSHLKTCTHMNKFNKVNNSFVRNPTFCENKLVILARLKSKTWKKQSMSPQKQQKMVAKETNW